MDVKASFSNMNLQITQFFQFINQKLANYTSLSLGEKIAYPVVGTGIILTLISLILFVL